MFKKIDSKDDLLNQALILVKESGLDSLNIRPLAKACNVSIGTIYNYFPSKQDLIVETVQKIWQGVFHKKVFDYKNMNFMQSVDWFEKSVKEGTQDFPNFLQDHRKFFSKEERVAGKETMMAYFGHIKMGFQYSLLNDGGTKQNLNESDITNEEFLEFVLVSIINCLVRDESTEVLKKVIRNLIK